MGEYLSSYTSSPAFHQGLALAANIAARRDLAERERQQQIEAERVQAERDDKQFRSQMALHSIESADRAREAKDLRTEQWRQKLVTDQVASYRQNLAAQYNQNADILKPENRWRYSPETIKAAEEQNAQLNQHESEAIAGMPSDYTKPIDTTFSWLKPIPPTIAVQESPAALADRKLKADQEQAKVNYYDLKQQETRARIGEINAHTRNLINHPPGSGSSGGAVSIRSAQSGINSALGAYSKFLASGIKAKPHPLDKSYGYEIQRPDDPDADIPPQAIAANAQYAAHAPKLIQAITSPQYLAKAGYANADDIARYIGHTAAGYNNIGTAYDLHGYLERVKQDAYYGKNPKLKQAAQSALDIFSGNAYAIDDAVSETDQDTPSTANDAEDLGE